ncbi:MAG: VOC family protein [Candidatus Bathyarchaeia archaeon]|jgi:predicted enzyme related to lactoylglutathione lyase
MPRVSRFEIPAEKPERAVEFYKKVFDWKIEKWQGPIPYFLVNTDGETGETGINGAIHENTHLKTTVNIVNVSSIDETLNESGSQAAK